VAILFHEMAHIYDFERGVNDERPYDNPASRDNGVKIRERLAVGLAVDDDGDPRTAERIDPGHPAELTENGLRAEMGLDLRTSYQ
jgi:hypothetical protein